jgi:hypothetical protein
VDVSVKSRIEIKILKKIAMKKRNLNLPILTLLFAIFGFSGIQAQFDDLYYDESNFETVQYRTDDVSNDEEYVAYQNVESSDYDFDEYDSYVDYQNQGYDLDAYQYTNRFDNYRLAVFANNYYGYNAFSGFNNGYYGNINRRIATDPFFAFYLRQELLFGPSYGSFYGGFNSFSPFGFNSVGLAFGNPYGGFGVNRGFGNRFGGFGGGFSSFGGGYYCPPYNAVVINNNNFTNSTNNRAFANSARATSSRTNLNSVRNTRISAPKATSSVRAKNIAVRDNSRASTATRSASTSSRSIRPSSTSSRTIDRTRTGTTRSFSPTNSTRSTRNFNPSSSSRRSSLSPSNSSSRSSGSVRSSGSSSTRSARPSSSSSSTRSVRKNN